MARTGRKRKQGKREAAGRISRAGMPRYDSGSEWVQAMRAKFGTYYNSPMGRAYVMGLLGEGAEASERMSNAGKFAALYKRLIGADSYRCPLNDEPRGGITEAHVDQSENWDWLLKAMKRMDDTGCRPYFDQLISRTFTDYGPDWLDRLVWAKRRDRRDTMILDAALKALDAIAGITPTHIPIVRILAA